TCRSHGCGTALALGLVGGDPRASPRANQSHLGGLPMLFSSWLVRPKSGRRISCKPRLELLEDRCVPSYTVTDLGSFGGSFNFGYAINNHGQVSGDSTTTNGENHGFLYSGGPLIDLGTLGGNFTDVWGMNNRGDVVGGSDVAIG